MTERLLSFLFLGILVTLGYHLLFNLFYQHFFATSTWLTDYWYLALIAIPAALLFWLAWRLGFYRHGGNRGADALAALILAALVFLTIPASYSCGLGCF
ncbi:MAG TPA: hypothetical protein VG501_02960 [Rhizomicrobium sp.]|nr:hypothetical protein [Rhizomicrobium sp.]